MQVQLNQLSLVELESMAYQQIKILKQTELNLNYIEQEINKRKQEESLKTKENAVLHRDIKEKP